jgi:hypothetical protein
LLLRDGDEAQLSDGYKLKCHNCRTFVSPTGPSDNLLLKIVVNFEHGTIIRQESFERSLSNIRDVAWILNKISFVFTLFSMSSVDPFKLMSIFVVYWSLSGLRDAPDKLDDILCFSFFVGLKLLTQELRTFESIIAVSLWVVTDILMLGLSRRRRRIANGEIHVGRE